MDHEESSIDINAVSVTVSSQVAMYSTTLIGLDSIEAFFELEKSFWTDGLERTTVSAAKSVIQIYNSHAISVLNQISNTRERVENNSLDQKVVVNLVQLVEAREIPGTYYPALYSDMRATKRIVEMLTSGGSPAIGCAAYFGKPNHALQTLNQRGGSSSLKYLFETAVILNTSPDLLSTESESSLARLQDRYAAEIQTLLTMRDNELNIARTKHDELVDKFDAEIGRANEATSSMNRQRNKLLQEYTREFKRLFEEATTEREALRAAYAEQMHLEGPAKYWANVAKVYHKRAMHWVYAFVTSVVSAVVILITLLYCPPEVFSASLFDGDPTAIKGVLMFATTISFLAYLSRMMTKLYLSYFHLQRDADERHILTTYYLSLIKHDAADKTDRPQIIQALFSRSDSGLLSTKEQSQATADLQGILMRMTHWRSAQ